MILEVGQSVKIGDTRGDTVLALANDESRAVLVHVEVKRHCLGALRRRSRRREWRKTTLILKLFSAALFLLLIDHMGEAHHLIIDVEYSRHEAEIRGMLLSLQGKRFPGCRTAQITFARVGKASPAHKKAIRALRRQELPDQVLRTEDILSLF